MDISEVVKQLQATSLEQVIVRVRQYPIEDGRDKRHNQVTGGVFVQDITKYRPAVEVQMIACHPYTCGRTSGYQGLVWISYVDPPPRARNDYKKPLPLRSAVWAGEEAVEMAWNAICSSWAHCPNWISPKPVVLCRQYKPDEGYIEASATDVLYLRLLDQLRGKVESHKYSSEKRMEDIAAATLPGHRGAQYSAWLRVSDKKRWLLGALIGRLERLVDSHYGTLATSLGVSPVTRFELPSE